MSVSKLLSRIVHPGQVTSASHDAPDKEIAKDLHDHTFGITSDPLTHFACVLAALIHDVDEMARLRQILVNVVMATDIMDRELGQMRKSRWEKAFKNGSDNGSSTASGSDDDVNRKASIVLEHLIQASDVSHTMQHFTVFRKWNEKLFCEMYQAYLAGRLAKDPTESWYTGELGFFDYYIIPLAKKLETCGVFGVSSLEYLSYAEANRREWQEKGEEIVKDYVARFLQKQKTQIADVPESDEIDI